MKTNAVYGGVEVGEGMGMDGGLNLEMIASGLNDVPVCLMRC